MVKTVALVLFPGAIACELVIATELVGTKFRTHVATPSGADHVDASGLVYRADSAFNEVELDGCAAILVAGGGLLSIKDNAELNQLLRRANDLKLLIGAICAGPLALAQAGILAGHRYTQGGYYPASAQHLWDGAEFVEETLVVSRNIITAMPEAHVDFAVEVARQLGVFESASEAERKRSLYNGTYQRDWSKLGAGSTE